MKRPEQHFIIIDDDEVNSGFCTFLTGVVSGSKHILTLPNAERMLEHIASPDRPVLSRPVVVLLNINLPGYGAWEFLHEYDKLGPEIHRQFAIYIMTASVSEGDRARAKSNKHVKKLMIKPISRNNIVTILKDISA